MSELCSSSKFVIFSGFKRPIVGSLKGDDRKFSPISGNRCPDGSLYRGDWGIAKDNFFFWLLDRGVGVFVISKWRYLVVRGDVSEHKGDLGCFFSFFFGFFGGQFFFGFFVFPMVN